ncbi:MAG: flagellar accessory protein FlaH [Ignisphaera sp.]|nr:flagellar accessory protein FlaH [Ignisphaera sp.]MCX8167929.1 flagellar accessory protein FlaH [Ignisphaera sp.]MDW8086164.1 ATPase domain-containing protein [Ignisphaera sp.]
MLQAIPTGNEELDTRLGGGVPIPSLVMIEGDHGSGKTVVAQQVVYGALKSGLKVSYVTTEATVREFILQSKRVSLDLSQPFIKGILRVYPIHLEGARWTRDTASKMLPILGKFAMATAEEWDLFVVDSFSVLAVFASVEGVMDVLTRFKQIASGSRVVILTIHPNSMGEDVMIRARAVCDGYIRLRVTDFGGRMVKVMEVVKLRGALGPVDSTIVFDVDPAFGIKILPISFART